MCLLDHPSARSHHLSTTRQPCGPGDRPYPPRPRSHLATHIVRFVTHLARKSISELLHRKDSFSLYDCSNTRILFFLRGTTNYPPPSSLSPSLSMVYWSVCTLGGSIVPVLKSIVLVERDCANTIVQYSTIVKLRIIVSNHCPC